MKKITERQKLVALISGMIFASETMLLKEGEGRDVREMFMGAIVEADELVDMVLKECHDPE